MTCKMATVQKNQKSILSFFGKGDALPDVVEDTRMEDSPPAPLPVSSSSSSSDPYAVPPLPDPISDYEQILYSELVQAQVNGAPSQWKLLQQYMAVVYSR